MEIPGRLELEVTFAERVAKLTERQRRRLVRVMGTPPDPANVPDSFWQEVEEETQRETVAILVLLFMASANYHASGDVTGKRLEPTTQKLLLDEAEIYANRQSKQVARGYRITSVERFETMLKEFEKARLKKPEEPLPLKRRREIVLPGSTRVFGPQRAEAVAVTETTAAQSAGGDAGVRATTGLSQRDQWITEADGKVCNICSPLHKTPRSFWGLKYVDGPPAHPNCRCTVKYESEGWWRDR